jgi:hypothetical protein
MIRRADRPPGCLLAVPNRLSARPRVPATPGQISRTEITGTNEYAEHRISIQIPNALNSADPGVSGSGGVGRLNDRLRGRSASVVVPGHAAWRGCMVWPWRKGSARGRGFGCSWSAVARWVTDRCVRALFCVARRCSVLVFSLVTPYRCWSAEVPSLHGMQEVSGSSPLSSTWSTI